LSVTKHWKSIHSVFMCIKLYLLIIPLQEPQMIHNLIWFKFLKILVEMTMVWCHKKMEGNCKSIHSLADFSHCKLFMDYFQTKAKQRRCYINFYLQMVLILLLIIKHYGCKGIIFLFISSQEPTSHVGGSSSFYHKTPQFHNIGALSLESWT
jgi:hypothetical protein